MSRWYRAYEGTVTDAKLGEAALIAECSRSVAIATWHCILESCASTQNGGIYDTSARRVAVILGEKPATIEQVFAAFTELGMISDGAVTAWKQRQYESDTSTERSKKHRERKRAVAQQDCNGDATLQQRDATAPETDTDTDTETEREKSARAEDDPTHWKVAQAIIADRASGLTDWEIDFLHSIKWAPDLTKTQAASLKAIEGKITSKESPGSALPSVKRGTPQFDAWIAHYRQKNGGRPTFHEGRDAITVPSEYPPREQVAA